MERVIITGATSMLGIALIEECIKNDVETLAVVRKGSLKTGRIPVSPLVKVCECDLDDLEYGIKTSGKYDCFYHFAWEHTEKENRDNSKLQQKNIESCLKAVTAAQNAGCKKFIGAGSQAEYGPKDERINEDTRTDPATAYGIAKYAAGKLSRKLCDRLGMVHIWGRIFSVYGPHDNPATMVSYALRQFKNGEAAKFSDAVQMWNYLYESDAGKIFYRLGSMDLESSIYCIASRVSRPLKEYIIEMKDVTGGRMQCEFDNFSDRKNYGIEPDITKLENAIGRLEEVPFSTGIRNLLMADEK